MTAVTVSPVAPDKLCGASRCVHLTVPEVIEKLKANKMEYKERIAQLRERNVYAFGHSSKIGAKYIINLV